LERDGRYKTLGELRQGLVEIYRGLFRKDPPHGEVEKFKQRVDALNNLGVSAWDLGREQEAMRWWQEALKQDSQHLEATFNSSYAQWQKGEMKGKECVGQMERLKLGYENNPAYWECLAWIQLEQMNISEVEKIQGSEYRVKDERFKQEFIERAKPWRRFISWMSVTKERAKGGISTSDWRRSHPHPLLCKVRTVASLSKVTELLRSARASIEKGAFGEAGRLLNEARLMPGYERDEEIQKVSDWMMEKRLARYEFEVVTLNATGGVVERRRGQARSYSEDLGDGVKLEMVAILGGTFEMGSPSTEAERFDSEGPVHKVTIPSFYMGKYPVTQAQWRAVAGRRRVKLDLNPDPSRFKGDDLPVESVSWDEAVEFCQRLSRATGSKYRLPSEAEWEYACRAGTRTPFHFGETITPEYVNYNGNYPYGQARKGEYRQRTTPVGSLGAANGFGLYDMHGNVWEWCQDWYGSYPQGAVTDPQGPSSGSARVARGGSRYRDAGDCRSAYRYFSPDDRYDSLGLRLVRTAW
jgi:formylglycine-generating enzyme required for sulfatase activity